ncbi:14293_t:CDS:2 [Racocetra fulgida]|uniref:14293_t:CDS:1 n=1 Tax=Racocetra fulgida TaxID=60492 RepID=A0A9N8Z7L8_9GLOM|nr:14293_t:CDS:2 [Racocetra fulgida]
MLKVQLKQIHSKMKFNETKYGNELLLEAAFAVCTLERHKY